MRPTLSVTLTVNVKSPARVGMPVMLPTLASARPSGKDPLTWVHVSVPTPPAAPSVTAYGVVEAPPGKEFVVINKPLLT